MGYLFWFFFLSWLYLKFGQCPDCFRNGCYVIECPDHDEFLAFVRTQHDNADVLNVNQVRELAAWLNRYLNLVAPTEESVKIAGARAHARGIDRNLTALEALQSRMDNSKGDKG